MPSPCLHLCKNYCVGFHFHQPNTRNFSSSLSLTSKFPNPKRTNGRRRLVAQSQSRPANGNGNGQNKRDNSPKGKNMVTVKGQKDNIWSVDNEMAKAEKEKERERSKRGRRKGKRVVKGRKNRVGNVLVSGSMLMEVETVLQTQEPVIKPAWNTFASSVSGIWKGVGAVFSPITAEMEPIEIGKRNENLYDCYTLVRVEAVPSPAEKASEIHRKINWVTLNPHGEVPQLIGVGNQKKEESRAANSTLLSKETVSGSVGNHVLPSFESFDLATSDVMEEDVMGNEPGLVFFEDGSYSRGPLDIPVGEVDESNYFLSPTFKFEQCLVKGCHKRLRIVHTIEFGNGGSDVQIMRVAVYEEQWVSPVNLHDESDLEFDLKPFSQRKRTQPSELTGSWKVFEVSATPIYGDDIAAEGSGAPYVYLCTETLKKRSLPESSVYFGEEEILDMQDVTVLWLPGGVTGYVDVNKDGILTVGVGWYSEEGINLVMERDYGIDGKLKEVRWKSEVKRRWTDPLPV